MSDLADTALADVGHVPYVFGAPPEAMDYAAANRKADCSSAVEVWVMRATGITIPRTADRQYQWSEAHRVYAPFMRNDLFFFGGWGGTDNPPGYAGVQHVAISLGGDALVEETNAGPGNVRVGSLSSYGSNFLYATRPFGDAMIPLKLTGGVGTARLLKTDGTVAATLAAVDPRIRLFRLRDGAHVTPTKLDYDVAGGCQIGPGQVTPLYANTVAESALLVDLAGDACALLSRNATFTPATKPAGPIAFSTTVPFRGSVAPDGTITFS